VAAGRTPRGNLTVDEQPVPLATTIDAAVTALGVAVRRELRRLIMGLVTGVVSLVLLLAVALVFVVAGAMRLGDALGHACGQWFGNQALGDATVGIVLLAIPLVGVLVLRWRSRK